MALDVAEIRDLTRETLYGTGLGEKPSMAIGSGTAVVTGDTVVFSVTDGDKLRAGDVLTAYGAATKSVAYGFYVISVATNALTCVNGYEGAAIADSASVAGTVFEVMPLVSQEKMFEAAEVIIERFLWPEVFDIATGTVTPDLTSCQVDLDSRDEELLAAWQVIGPSTVPISYYLQKDINTALFSSGNMGSFDFIDASTTYYTTKRRINATDSTSTSSLSNLIATGAAALCLGGTQVETTLDSAKKDAQDRGQKDISGMLWRDFLTQKQVYSEDLSRDTVLNFVIERN